MNAHHRFPIPGEQLVSEARQAHTDGHAEYRARRLVRELRKLFGDGGTRELLERLQDDMDERVGR